MKCLLFVILYLFLKRWNWIRDNWLGWLAGEPGCVPVLFLFYQMYPWRIVQGTVCTSTTRTTGLFHQAAPRTVSYRLHQIKRADSASCWGGLSSLAFVFNDDLAWNWEIFKRTWVLCQISDPKTWFTMMMIVLMIGEDGERERELVFGNVVCVTELAWIITSLFVVSVDFPKFRVPPQVSLFSHIWVLT